MAVQEYFTPRELAELAAAKGLTGFPASERGVRLHAERDGWNDLPDHLTRLRPPARHGGRPSFEYHRSLLPERMQSVLHGAARRSELRAAHDLQAEADRRQLAAIRASALCAHARAVMQARAEILTSIDGYGISQGQTRAWAVGRFLGASAAAVARQEIEARRDRGAILTGREAASLAQPLLLTAEAGFGLDLKVLATANDRRGAPKVGRSTLYGWFKTRDERGPVALAPAPTKQPQPIPAGFAGFLKFYAIGSKPDAADALKSYLDTDPPAHLKLTLDQVRYILRVKLNNIEKHIGREGILTLRSRLAYVQRITDDLLPTTIYTADGKTFDAEIADPVSRRPMRPEITSVLDVATRRCVGFAVSRKENVIAVTEALRRSVSACGLPAIFYTDRGAGYKNKAFDDDIGGLMGRLGIAKMHALPYNSQAKGIVERFNAQWNTLARRLPTYIGEDMDKEAGSRVHKLTRADIREFGVSTRLPSWDDFIAMCEAHIAEYNATPHRGLPRFEDPVTGRLRHMSPDEAWAAHVADGFEPVTIAPEDEGDLFRPYEIRKVRRALVEWNTNQYFHADLEAYHERRVMVGYDLHQAERVWVREFDGETGQPGRLICVATYSGNKVGYIPKTFEASALEQRMRTQHKRIDEKRRAIDEQAAPSQIEHQRADVADFIDLKAEPQLVALAIDNTSAEQALAQPPRRRVFRSDEELAAWALEHPEELTPNQIAVLKDCLSRPTARELFRLSGIDTEALRTLLRAAA